MTTDIDICNRALLLLGTQKTISSLTQDSTEAETCNTMYANVRDWCLGIVNWNFARRIATLTPIKVTGSPWVSTNPAPPWKFEYQSPTDALIIRYVTNLDLSADATFFLGEPKRFVVAVDKIATVDTHVILTNESEIIAIYTAQMSDPTFWPWYFERFMVSTLAWNLSMTLVNNDRLVVYLDNIMARYFDSAYTANLAEGLSFNDTTPEWIQALGINYPYRRFDGKETSKPTPPASVGPNDNRR